MKRGDTGAVLSVIMLAAACTSTAVSVSQAPEPVSRTNVRIAVLQFANAPNSTGTGPEVREITMDVLAKQHGAFLVSLSKVDLYQSERSFSPSEHDVEALERAGHELGAEVLLWGKVNQFTAYHFDRMAPATPPYVELTLFAFEARRRRVAKATGHKQGSIPATIWSRQPTFSDVARPVLEELIRDLDAHP